MCTCNWCHVRMHVHAVAMCIRTSLTASEKWRGLSGTSTLSMAGRLKPTCRCSLSASSTGFCDSCRAVSPIGVRSRASKLRQRLLLLAGGHAAMPVGRRTTPTRMPATSLPLASITMAATATNGAIQVTLATERSAPLEARGASDIFVKKLRKGDGTRGN